jgi:hypothetical protein
MGCLLALKQSVGIHVHSSPQFYCASQHNLQKLSSHCHGHHNILRPPPAP